MRFDRPSWIWPTEDGVRGLVLNTDAQILAWYDAVSNMCGDDGSTLEQSRTTFELHGAPATIGQVPEDVLNELQAALHPQTTGT